MLLFPKKIIAHQMFGAWFSHDRFAGSGPSMPEGKKI
jgi:hypothetical protein